jgi:hypothetical protein
VGDQEENENPIFEVKSTYVVQRAVGDGNLGNRLLRPVSGFPDTSVPYCINAEGILI